MGQANDRLAERADTVSQLRLSSSNSRLILHHYHQRHVHRSESGKKSKTVTTVAFRGATLTVLVVGLRTQLFRQDVGSWCCAQCVHVSSKGLFKVAFWRVVKLYTAEITTTNGISSASIMINLVKHSVIAALRQQCEGVEDNGCKANYVL